MAWRQSYLIVNNLLRMYIQGPLRHSTFKHLLFLSIKILLTTQPMHRGIPLERKGGWEGEK